MTTHRKKRGRPPFLWHARRGEEFVTAVSITRYERRPNGRSLLTAAQAIRLVLRRHEFAQLRKYKGRYLEKQYSNALEFWSPWPSYKKLFGRGKRIRQT